MAWKKVSQCTIHSRRRQPSNDRTGKSHLNVLIDSGTFINSGQGMGYPPKISVGSNTDEDIPPQIPIIENYCRTCLTEGSNVLASPCPTEVQN